MATKEKIQKNLDIADGYNLFRERIDTVIYEYRTKTAITYMLDNKTDKKWSFDEVGKILSNRQIQLKKLGYKQGDRIAVISPHSPYGVLTGLALAYVGITSVLIDASLPRNEIKNLLEYSDVRGVFTTELIYNMIVENDDVVMPCFNLEDSDNLIVFNQNMCFCRQLPETQDPEQDVIAILFSSGTTDKMKGIKRTYLSVLKEREVFVRLAGLEDYMTYLLALPFNHIAGFSCAITYFLTGCELGFIEAVNASKLQEGLLKFQPYCFAMVPRIYELMEQKVRAELREKGKVYEISINLLLSLSGFLRKNFGINIGRKLFKRIRRQMFGENIVGVGTGACPCQNSTAEFFLNIGLEWLNFYATTETGVPITATGIHDIYPNDTVGNVNAHPEIQIKIKDPDEQGIGEIQVKSELVMKGYFREPEFTNEAFEGEYFKTGDYGYVDKKGYLHITGRIKESIVLQNGKKVSPVNVDDFYSNGLGKSIVLASRGVIKEGREHDEIHLFVENKQYSDQEKNEITEKINELSRKAPTMYKVEKTHFISQIPKTSIGKVKRFCLTIEEVEKTQICKEGAIEKQQTEEIVIACIRKVLKNAEEIHISYEQKLKDDIGLDSLNLFELCIDIYEKTGKSIEGRLTDNTTVGDVIEFLEGNLSEKRQNKANSFSPTIVFDTDGTLTDFNYYIDNNAIPYFKKKYGMKVVYPDKLEVQDIMNMDGFFLDKGFSKDKSHEETIKAVNKYWTGFNFFKYSILNRFRPGVNSFINELLKNGWDVQIHTSRFRSTEKSLIGRIIRICTLLQFRINGVYVSKNKINFYSNDEEKIRGIMDANPIVVFDDKTKIIENLSNNGLNVICVRGKHNTEITDTKNITVIENFEYDLVKEKMRKYINASFDIYTEIKKSDKYFKKMTGLGFLINKLFNPVVLHYENLSNMQDVGIVYAPNHRSTLDPLVITSVIKKNIHWAALQRFFEAKDSIFNNSKNPVLCNFTAKFFKKMGYFPIERKADNSDADNYKSIIAMKEYLELNQAVGIFGEGTTSIPEGKDFGTFDDTFLVLAKSTCSVIQPITLLWIDDLNMKEKVIVNFGIPFFVKENNLEYDKEKFLSIQEKNLQECYEYKKLLIHKE